MLVLWRYVFFVMVFLFYFLYCGRLIFSDGAKISEADIWYHKKWEPRNIWIWGLFALFPSSDVFRKVGCSHYFVFSKICLPIVYLIGVAASLLDLVHGLVVMALGLSCPGKCMYLHGYWLILGREQMTVLFWSQTTHRYRHTWLMKLVNEVCTCSIHWLLSLMGVRVHFLLEFLILWLMYLCVVRHWTFLLNCAVNGDIPF